MPRNETPVLEVGGSHVTAAVVDPDHADPVGKAVRLPLDSTGDAASAGQGRGAQQKDFGP